MGEVTDINKGKGAIIIKDDDEDMQMGGGTTAFITQGTGGVTRYEIHDEGDDGRCVLAIEVYEEMDGNHTHLSGRLPSERAISLIDNGAADFIQFLRESYQSPEGTPLSENYKDLTRHDRR